MNEFDVYDTILYPLTYNDLILMAQNINPDSGKTLRGELIDLLAAKTEEALELFDAHEEEIYLAAAGEDPEEQAETDIPADKIETLAQEIYQLLLRHEMWIDTHIYFNGKCMGTSGKDENGKEIFRYNGEPFITENEDPRRYFEYVGPYLSMSFEGPLYHAVNYGGYDDFLTEFDALLEKFGLYYELGNAWNLSLYSV